MKLNVALNEELALRIWSFPMRYQPTDLPDRSYIGERWKRYELRSLQLILQATHGVVSGHPVFFRRAFGNTVSEFQAILLRPHRYIFNRDWYEKYGGRTEFDSYQAHAGGLSHQERTELLQLLSSCDPREFPELKRQASTQAVRRVLDFYKHYIKETGSPNLGTAKDICKRGRSSHATRG